jgi:predicted nucleic acid-binding protein
VTVFVDTSAFYAALDGDDDEHARAVRGWSGLLAAATPLLTSNYVVVETSALVQHRLGLKALRAFTEDVLAIVRVEWVTPSDHAAATAALMLAARRKLSLVDCASFELMRRLAVRRAFAYDRHFREAGFDLV